MRNSGHDVAAKKITMQHDQGQDSGSRFYRIESIAGNGYGIEVLYPFLVVSSRDLIAIRVGSRFSPPYCLTEH